MEVEGITRTSLAAAGTSPPAMVALEYGSGRAVFGPMNGLTQPWGKGTNGYAYYNRNRSNALLLSTAAWLANGGADADGDGLTEMETKNWQLESDLSMLWEPGTKWAYALLCAGRYDEALEAAEKTMIWFKKQKQWTQDYDADYSIIFMIPTCLQ